MSHHRDKRNSPELDGLLRQHRLATDTPSQLSDAFRLGYWSAQAEIERLRKEAERLSEQNRALLDEQIPCACGYDSPDDVCGKHHPTFLRKIDAAHNSAIEAAALVQVLRMEEGGSRHISHLSAEAQSAIRALKRLDATEPKPIDFTHKPFGRIKPECATEGCGEPSVDHIILGGIGSDYCLECADKVIAAQKGGA